MGSVLVDNANEHLMELLTSGGQTHIESEVGS